MKFTLVKDAEIYNYIKKKKERKKEEILNKIQEYKQKEPTYNTHTLLMKYNKKYNYKIKNTYTDMMKYIQYSIRI